MSSDEEQSEIQRLAEENARLVQQALSHAATIHQANTRDQADDPHHDEMSDQASRPTRSVPADQSSSSPLSVAPYFADKIEASIQRLKGNNWATWKWQLFNVLDAKGLTYVLESNEERGSGPEVATRQIISGSLDASLVSKVVHCTTAQQIWSTLRGIYENRTSFALTDLIGRMNSYQMTSLEDVESGISEIQSMACQIKALGGAVDDATTESAILRALPKTFSTFITSWTFLETEKRTLDNLHAHLMRTVCQLRADEPRAEKDKALIAASRKPAGKSGDPSKQQGKSKGPNKKSDQSSKKKFCRYCKSTDHLIDDCQKLAKKKAAEAKQTPQAKAPSDSSESTTDADAAAISSARVAYGHVATLEKGENSCLTATSDPGPEYLETTWLADSGASFHMTSHLEWLAGYERLEKPLRVSIGDNNVLYAVGKGFIETSTGVLDPVYYLPKISMNLFSTAFCAKYHKIFSLNTDKDIRFYDEQSNVVFRGYINDAGIYELKFTIKLAEHSAFLSASLSDWHDRLGHTSTELIRHMADNNIVDGLKIGQVPKPKCEPCVLGKQTRVSHPLKSTPRGSHPGEIMHFDTIGPLPEKSLGGALYYVLCKDSFSNYRHVFFVQSKALIPEGVKQIITLSSIQTGHDVKQIHTDNGSEYLNATLKVFLSQKGIVHTTSASYTAEQNGFIERDIRTVAEMARAMRIRASLPKPFWAEAIGTAVYVLNRVVNSSNRDKTPFELWFGRKPSLKNIHRFGESAVVYTEARYRDKLDAKGVKMVFTGYTEVQNTYRFIDSATGKLVISCNAVFLNSEPDSGPSEPEVLDTDLESGPSDSVNITIERRAQPSSPEKPIIISSTPKSSRRTSPDPPPQNSTFAGEPSTRFEEAMELDSAKSQRSDSTIQFVRTEPAEMAPENPDQSRIRSLRPRTNRPLYTEWASDEPTAQTSSLSEDPPKSAKEAAERPDWPKWQHAMRDEYDSLVENKVFELVDLPSDRKVRLMSCRWVFARKKDGRYKARLVARGYEQIHGVHYFETYAPTPNMEDIRLCFAFAAVNNLAIAQFDIKTAFLYGEIDAEIFMSQPELFETGDNKVWRLVKSLYGLKQSPRQWSHKFASFLVDIGLDTSSENECIFFRRQPLLVVAVYVDDGIVFAADKDDIRFVLDKLRTTFKVHVMDVANFLGFQIVRPRDHQIILHQADYTDSVLRRFGVPTNKYENAPISPCKLAPSNAPFADIKLYQSLVGSLLYLSLITRIDIAFAVHKASRGSSSPTQNDYSLTQRTLRYLNGTRTLGLSYTRERNRGFEVYTDADLGGCDETLRSTTGSVVFFAGAPVFWRSARQKSVTRSSTEAELVSLDQTVTDVIRISNLAVELGFVKQETITIHCDNESVVHIVSNERSNRRYKLQKIKSAFVREQVIRDVVRVKSVKSEDNLADMLTKALPIKNFQAARNKMLIDALAKVAFIALVASCAMPTASIKFDSVRPIIYERSEHFVDIGEYEYTIDFTYVSPCRILDSFLPARQHASPADASDPNANSITSDPQQEAYVHAFIKDCDRAYADTWMRKVEDLTKVVIPKQLFEPIDLDIHQPVKRSLLETAVFGTVVFNFLSSIFTPYQAYSNYAKIQRLEDFQQHENHRLQEFTDHFNMTRAIEKNLLDLAAQNARNIRDLKKQISFFAEMSRQLTWLCSVIQTKIAYTTSDLKVVINEAQRGRVATHELADLFNITELHAIYPIDTRLESITKIAAYTFRFKFYVNKHSTDTFIYQLHPFRYWSNLTGLPELLEYQGSSHVVWNKTANCIRGLQRPAERNVFEHCSTRNFFDPRINKWRKMLADYNVDGQDVTHVLKTSYCNYVYCFPSNITVQSQTVPCPTEVFKLPLSVPFNTGQFVHEYVPRKVIAHMENIFIDSIHISHFNDTLITVPDVAMFRRIQEYIQKDLEREKLSSYEWRVSKQGPAIWTLGGLILTLLLTIFALVGYLNRVVARGHRKIKKDLNALSSNYGIYQKTECSNCANVIKELKSMNKALLDKSSNINQETTTC